MMNNFISASAQREIYFANVDCLFGSDLVFKRGNKKEILNNDLRRLLSRPWKAVSFIFFVGENSMNKVGKRRKFDLQPPTAYEAIWPIDPATQFLRTHLRKKISVAHCP